MQIRELQRSCRLERGVKNLLIEKIFSISREQIIKGENCNLCPKKLREFRKIENKILKGEAPQYAMGQASFFGRDFFVDKNVLIPCPETELLVEKAIGFLKNKSDKNLRILDIGTGSGVIPITIIEELKDKKISADACDISTSALKVAKRNQKKFKTKVNFIECDLFEQITGKFDLISANLPYGSINDSDFKSVPHPKLAVIGGESGFEIISRCLSEIDKFLKQDGLALFEIGHDQRKMIEQISKRLPALKFRIYKDLNNFDRIVQINWKTHPKSP
ncbi:MAG: Release factor glutamine methyltransferase [candidate division WS2 bacterium ADurb.Bin280]|uniref:Release factor glutamine methyltransferase n=1 Tax=candidate division WS2 bacterium ADurb.Bin280 TaxID=1852829 RepID=A0A1V5SC36_9BACT|nr:MAG: Release factor glutamine methyltransferase [candidate division WS2 bacterium ADurb.Bin280]